MPIRRLPFHRYLRSAWLALALLPALAGAEQAAPEAAGGGRSTSGRIGSIFTDIKDYVTAPLRWDETDWVYFGGAITAIAAAHSFDARVHRSFTRGQAVSLDGKDPHSISDAVPAALAVGGTLLVAVAIDNADGRSETWSMLEAAGLGSATAYVFKFAAGRDRPNESTNSNQWRKSGTSFPSIHVTAATAIGTVLAESGADDYRWVRRFLGYGIAAGTAYLRLKHNEHWLSDTVAGGALGFSSATFALNRDRPVERGATLRLSPMADGAMLSLTVPLR